MISLRYKPLKNGEYSIYLDIYCKDKTGKSIRKYEFLDLRVSKDYCKTKNIAKKDKVSIDTAESIKAKRRLEIVNEQYDFKKKRDNPNFIDYVEKHFDTTQNNIYILLKHIKDYNENKPLTFNHISYDWLDGFKNYLLSDKISIQQNTAVNYLSRFKTILNKTIKSGIINESPFKNVDMPSMLDVDRTTLDIDELRQLVNTKIRTKFNHHIRQMFLFSCFTGIRLSDCKALTWDKIETDKLKIIMQKTKKIIYLPLSEQAIEILNEIEKHPENNKVFWKIPAHQNINLYLRLWGLEAGIKKHLHFHVARHSFATIGLTNGIDLYTMKELLGHKKIEMTQIYAKIVDQKKKQEIAKFPKL